MKEIINKEIPTKEKQPEEEQPVKKFCLQCKNEIPSDSTRFSARRFCTRRCNRRYFSLKRYHKIKKSEKYKEYRKKYYKTWLENNRDKFNKSMREVSLRYQRKMKAIKLKAKQLEIENENKQTFNNANELNKIEVDN